eukprot:1711359-Amphidinium_carterae.1
MPRAWFKPFCAHARSLFGLPVTYHTAVGLQMLLQIKAVHGLSARDCAGYTRAMEQFERHEIAEHPLAGWLRKGALSTRHLAFTAALARGWVACHRDGTTQWQEWESIKSHIRRLTTTH